MTKTHQLAMAICKRRDKKIPCLASGNYPAVRIFENLHVSFRELFYFIFALLQFEGALVHIPCSGFERKLWKRRTFFVFKISLKNLTMSSALVVDTLILHICLRVHFMFSHSREFANICFTVWRALKRIRY